MYGADNLFPQYLLDLMHGSATHAALCKSIAQMIAGKSIGADNQGANLKLLEWDAYEETQKIALDLKIHGGYAIEINYSLDRSQIVRARHLPFENVRSGKMDFDEKIRWYYYSLDWSQSGNSEYAPQKIRAFNPQEKQEHSTQILYVKPFVVGSTYYPKPDYIGAVNYIELEASIGEFHINNVRNGLSPSYSIHFKNGIPEREAREEIRRDIENNLSGSSNAGKFLITYSDDPERKPDVEPIQLSDADKQYQFLSEESTNKIMIGHRVVSPAMFGVKTEGQLGSTEELKVASELFEQQVVLPSRTIIERSWEKILSACGHAGSVTINRATPSFEEMSAAHQPEDLLEDLLALGEDAPEGYVEIDAREVDYDFEPQFDTMFQFAREIATKGSNDSEQDNELFKIRYRYKGETSSDSRKFCQLMVNSKKFFKKEDILNAGTVNPGFGYKGADRYNIWLFKGGPRCHHFWERVTFLQENSQQISVNRARKIINAIPAKDRDQYRIPVNERRVSALPNDMKHKGYHPSNENMPKDAKAKTSGL